MAVCRLSVEDFTRCAGGKIAAAIGDLHGAATLSVLGAAAYVADGTSKFVVRDGAGRPRAAVLCSAPAAPDMVERAMQRARCAKATLDCVLGERVLDPLLQGRVQGLSYAVLPYCDRLSDFPPRWAAERVFAAPCILDWLWQLTGSTVHDPQPAALIDFALRLRHVASMTALGGRARAAAETALTRLESGAWLPRYVLMHGDLWKHNLLVDRGRGQAKGRPGARRIVVIDWPGSETSGYAMFDLIRLAESFRLSRRRLRREVERHCRILGCDVADAHSYLLAALGHVGLTLERFPFERYLAMAQSCIGTLDEVAD